MKMIGAAALKVSRAVSKQIAVLALTKPKAARGQPPQKPR
jgi:hypothetical protein